MVHMSMACYSESNHIHVTELPGSERAWTTRRKSRDEADSPTSADLYRSLRLACDLPRNITCDNALAKAQPAMGTGLLGVYSELRTFWPRGVVPGSVEVDLPPHFAHRVPALRRVP